MSEHKTGNSNLTEQRKKDYWDRRRAGLPGLPGYAIQVQLIEDKDGKVTDVIPVSGKRPPKSIRFYTRPPFSPAVARKVSAYLSSDKAIR